MQAYYQNSLTFPTWRLGRESIFFWKIPRSENERQILCSFKFKKEMAPRVNEEPFGAGSTTGMTRFHTDYAERLFNHARRRTTNHPPNRTIVSRYRATDPVGGLLYAPKYFPLIVATIKPPTHKSELLFIC